MILKVCFISSYSRILLSPGVWCVVKLDTRTGFFNLRGFNLILLHISTHSSSFPWSPNSLYLSWSFWHLLLGMGWLDLHQFMEALSSSEVMQEHNLVLKVSTSISLTLSRIGWSVMRVTECLRIQTMSEPKRNQKAQVSQLMRFWTTVSCILPIYKYHYAVPSPFAFPASLCSMRAGRVVAFRLHMCNHHDLVWELNLEGR